MKPGLYRNAIPARSPNQQPAIRSASLRPLDGITRLMFTFLLVVLLLPSLAPADASGSRQTFNDALAVQLWSFRDDFQKDVPGTLQRVRKLGFRYVELAGTYGMTARQFRRALDKAGLKAVSMHIEYETARDRTDEVIREAKILGVQYVGVPWIKSPFTRSDCLAAIRVFNQAGRKLAAARLKFFYHLHGYEFVPDEDGKGTLFDLLMKKTDPRYVSLQLDTYHVMFPGQDPIRLMQQYPGRFSSLHLKDISKEVVGDDSGDFRAADARPLGQGKTDWSALLQAAQRERLRWYIIEDETVSVWQNIQQSLDYLATINK